LVGSLWKLSAVRLKKEKLYMKMYFLSGIG